VNILLSNPLVRVLSLYSELVVHSPAYSWDAEDAVLQGKTRENGQLGTAHMDGWDERPSATHWGNSLLGSLSTGSLVGHLSLLRDMVA